MADKYNFPTREVQSANSGYLKEISQSLKTMAGMQVSKVSELSHSQLHALISSGQIGSYVKVGDQIVSPWSDGTSSNDVKWDIGHIYDGSDSDHPLVTLSDGSKVPGLGLQMHSSVPFGFAFDAKQAFYCQDAVLAAGTYHFTADVSISWGSSGEWATTGKRSFQFTTTKDVSAKGQLVFSGDPYNAKLTTMQVQTYAQFDTTAIESVAITAGTGGTDLGTLSYTVHDFFNAIPRATYGSNDWSESALRQWLNSDSAAGKWQTQQTRWQRPHLMASTKAGFISGLDPDFLAGIALVAVKTESHPNSLQAGAVETTNDRIFPLSEREHYLSNYLNQSSSGYEAEGVAWDYWKRLAQAHGYTAPYTGWQPYPELITYDLATATQARSVWLRSAGRWTNYSNNVGYVNSSGNVGSTNANHAGISAAPACIYI